MAKRHEATQARALQLPPAPRRHVGLDSGFVDEDQTPGIEPGLPHPPSPTPAREIGASLSKREQDFLKLRPSRRRNSHTALCEPLTLRAASSSFAP
jgi:hypothetical protein